MLLVRVCYAQFGHVIPPQIDPPDSLAMGKSGHIYVYYFVEPPDKILTCEIASIDVLDTVLNRLSHAYSTDPKFMKWSAEKGRFEPSVKVHLRHKNTKSGLLLARKLDPWVKALAPLSHFQILDSSKTYRKPNLHERYAYTYITTIHFGPLNADTLRCTPHNTRGSRGPR
jgi:hypothetical protein